MRTSRHAVFSRTLFCGGIVSVFCLANSAVAAIAASEEAGLEEIIITAEKYKSTILDTPISISAMSGDQLGAAGITTVEEITREVPGISMRSAGPGLTE